MFRVEERDQRGIIRCEDCFADFESAIRLAVALDKASSPFMGYRIINLATDTIVYSTKEDERGKTVTYLWRSTMQSEQHSKALD